MLVMRCESYLPDGGVNGCSVDVAFVQMCLLDVGTAIFVLEWLLGCSKGCSFSQPAIYAQINK